MAKPKLMDTVYNKTRLKSITITPKMLNGKKLSTARLQNEITWGDSRDGGGS